MHCYELSDRQWDRIASFFPHRTHDGNVGHPFNDPRSLVNGILWVLHTGILGVISLNATARGKPSSAASMPGARTALGAVSSPRCWTNW